MQPKHLQPVGPTHMTLDVRFEAPDLSRKEAIKRHLALGNPLLDTDDGVLIAVHQTERIGYEAVEGELVWQCDYCGAYDPIEKFVIAHEQSCGMNPERE